MTPPRRFRRAPGLAPATRRSAPTGGRFGRSLPLAFLLLAWMLPASPIPAPAQEDAAVEPPRPGRREPAPRRPATRPSNTRRVPIQTGASRAPGAAPGRAPTPDATDVPDVPEAAEAAEAAEAVASGENAPESPAASRDDGFVAGLVAFIRAHATWIITVLGVALAAVAAWAFLGGSRRSTAGEPGFADLGSGSAPTRPRRKERFSSTRIQAAAVNDRLSKGQVETTEVETDREYALVVDEEALKMPPPPEEVDEHTGTEYVDDRDIESLLDAQDFPEAYARYVERIETDATLEFHSRVERELSAYFLRRRELEKAARVLEHHVATHAHEDIHAETYFNLGYIHFLGDAPKKSRRFLRLFVETETNPTYVERARRILERLELQGGGPRS